MFTSRSFIPMNRQLAKLCAASAAVVLAQFVTMQSALATGTASNTSVSNTVTVDYSVSSISQTQLSDTVSFVVDNKIDIGISVSNATVIPNSADQVVTYTITNEGNTQQGYALTVANSTVADDFNMNNVEIYVDSNGNGTYDAGTDTAYTSGSGNNAGNLNPIAGASYVPATDQELIVFIVSDTPPNGGGTSPTNGQIARYDLLVTALTNAGAALPNDSGTAWQLTGDNHTTVQVVFAEGAAGPHASDAANDGELSLTGLYTVSTASLTVSKTQDVTSDGFSAAGFEKAIPGATVTYTITLVNSGAVAAVIPLDTTAPITGVVDDFDDTNVTYVDNSVDVAITNNGVTVTDNNLTDNAGANGANTGARVTTTGAPTETAVTVHNITVPARVGANNGTAVITFDVTIK